MKVPQKEYSKLLNKIFKRITIILIKIPHKIYYYIYYVYEYTYYRILYSKPNLDIDFIPNRHLICGEDNFNAMMKGLFKRKIKKQDLVNFKKKLDLAINENVKIFRIDIETEKQQEDAEILGLSLALTESSLLEQQPDDVNIIDDENERKEKFERELENKAGELTDKAFEEAILELFADDIVDKSIEDAIKEIFNEGNN